MVTICDNRLCGFLEYVIKDKMNILKTACCRRSLGGSFTSFLLNFFRLPHDLVGPRFVQSVHTEEEWQVVQVKGYPTPLYWPHKDLKVLYAILSEQLYSWHWHYYQIAETRVEPGDVVFDCGAAEGIFPLLIKHIAKHIYCAEMLPEFQVSLQKTFRNDSNVSILPFALGDVPGEVRVPGKTGEDVMVPVKTIDEICSEMGVSVNYLKGDLEGNEMAVLEGARETIRKCKPKIAFACYHVGQDADEMTAFLKRCNPDYQVKLKGLSWCHGVRQPMILHAW